MGSTRSSNGVASIGVSSGVHSLRQRRFARPRVRRCTVTIPPVVVREARFREEQQYPGSARVQDRFCGPNHTERLIEPRHRLAQAVLAKQHTDMLDVGAERGASGCPMREVPRR